MEKNNPKVLNGWCLYDWANSVYSLVITSTIFPIYYGAMTRQADGTDQVSFLGIHIAGSVLFSYALSASFLIIACLSPILTAIADYSGRKKLFLQIFCYLGSASCAGLFFFTRDTFTVSVLLFMLATIGFSGSIVFYNAYLPEIATEDRWDKLSARGFSFGYIGSVILLVFSLAMVLMPEAFGITSESLPPRLSFLLTGIWWAGFAQITFARLHDEPRAARNKEAGWLLNGFRELRKVFHQVQELPNLKRFLMAFFFYNMGVQTVMYVAAIFGDKVLGLPSQALITTILILQLIAIAGSYLFAYLSSKFGNIKAISIAIIIWIGVCAGAYFVMTEHQFYLLAVVVGTVMGGIQALSRATYTKLLPETKDTASFFSFYDVTEKMAIVLGTLSYGLIEQLSGSMRNSVLALAAFFIIGFFLIMRVKVWTGSERKEAAELAAA
jgi:UMF1 family MFS transporter